MKPEIIFLSQEDVIAAGGMDIKETLKSVELGFMLHGRKECVQPPKINLRKGPPGSPQAEQGLIMALPGYVGGDYDVVGIKWVLAMAENPQKFGLPRSSALIILNDAETGLPLVIMDGTIVNAVRTGAVTGIGAKYLARSDSKVMALIGAGPQGRMQIRGVLTSMPVIEEVRIFDLNQERSENLSVEINSEFPVRVMVAESAEKAVQNSDIVVTATITTKPYLLREWFASGSFYGEIAANDATLAVYQGADKIFVDDWNQIKYHGVGTLVNGLRQGKIEEDVITGEMGEVIIGEKKGREDSDDLIIFKHIGMAATDLPEAYRIYKNAKSKGLGTKVALWKEHPVW